MIDQLIVAVLWHTAECIWWTQGNIQPGSVRLTARVNVGEVRFCKTTDEFKLIVLALVRFRHRNMRYG